MELATEGDVAAPSRMAQSVEMGSGPLQLGEKRRSPDIRRQRKLDQQAPSVSVGWTTIAGGPGVHGSWPSRGIEQIAGS